MLSAEETDPASSERIEGKIMAEFTAAQVQEHAEKAMEAFEDGFQWSDVFTLVPQVMEIVEAVGDMKGPEKEEAALMIIDYVIDNTNTPWIPDNLTDPLLKKGARFMIPMLIKAAKGKFEID
jgi:hypothetical protein